MLIDPVIYEFIIPWWLVLLVLSVFSLAVWYVISKIVTQSTHNFPVTNQ